MSSLVNGRLTNLVTVRTIPYFTQFIFSMSVVVHSLMYYILSLVNKLNGSFDFVQETVTFIRTWRETFPLLKIELPFS